MFKRRKTALALLAMAAAAVFVLPASSASAGTATVPNGCANSVTANFSQIQVTTSGDDGLTSVAPGGATTTSNLQQSAAIPGAIFVAGYNLGLLQVGANNIPANVRSTIEATNTVEGSQNTNIVGGVPPNGTVTVSTTITDPDGTPGTGDESGTDASFSVTYNNLNWTAAGSGTIEYRQQSIPAWPATDASNTLRIQALVGGFLNVVFRCAPATVTPPDPGTVVLIDPAASFDTTDIVVPDTAPTANAGPDQTVNEGALVTLDGTASSDPENEALTYNWTAPAGVTLTGANTATPTFTAPQVSANTDLTFTLEVCDQAPVLCSDPDDTVVVTVQNVDQTPTANAGADQTVTEGDLVTLNGTGSTDPDGEALTYAWTAPAGVTLTGANTASPTFTAPQVNANTDLTFTLEVCDEANPTSLCDTDTVVVTVLNIAGSAISINNASATEGGAVDFTVSLSGPQAGTVTVDFATANGSAVAPGDYTAATGTVTFIPGDTSETVTVQTNQDGLIEGDETFDVNLSNPTGNATIGDGLGVGTIIDDDVDNAPTANAGPDQTVTEGDLVTLDGTASSDPDGEALTYAWTAPAGITLTGAGTASPTFTAPDVAVTTPFTITLEVCDEANPASLCDTDTVVVTVNPIDDAPTANAGADQTVDEGTLVTLNGSGSSDPNGEALTYAWSQLTGPTVTLTGANTATPTFTAPQVDVNTDLSFQLEVCDAANPASLCATDTVTVTVRDVLVIRDAAGEVIVNGPVGPSTKKTSKSFTFKVSNIGMVPITINPADVTTFVTVNGTTTGSATIAGLPVTINPGASKRLKADWTYASGAFAAGATVEFNACVNLAGDIDTTNDCGIATVTAK